MEGLLFYWFTWIFWVIATFFLKKNSFLRLSLSFWLLLLIILSPYSFVLSNYEISYASILLVFSLLIFISQIRGFKAAYVLLCSFIVMLAYVCFHLFEFFDPVWVILPRSWMLSFVLISLSLLLHSNKIYRILVILLGSIQGEFLYAFILNKYSFPHIIGSYVYLDSLSLSTALLACWSGFEYLAAFYEKHINQLEKEKGKQKLS